MPVAKVATKVVSETFKFCSLCEDTIDRCGGCNKNFCPRHAIYCDNGTHSCSKICRVKVLKSKSEDRS